jgi:SAM-dependent methyltransferase
MSSGAEGPRVTTPARISSRPARGSHNGDLDRHAVARAYAHWAPVYDAICGPILASGRRAAAHAASRIGGRILEVGVGTGLLFDDYTRDAEITGIDLSEHMIAQARKRLRSGKYPHVKNLLIMDAHRLAFADASFDCVVIPFVITLVSNPEGVLSECARGEAGRRDHPGEPPLFGIRRARGDRAVDRAADVRARPAAQFPVPAHCRLGTRQRRHRRARTTQDPIVRCVHAGAHEARDVTRRPRDDRDSAMTRMICRTRSDSIKQI